MIMIVIIVKDNEMIMINKCTNKHFCHPIPLLYYVSGSNNNT